LPCQRNGGMANRTISWSKTALKQFEAAISYIASDSVANAEKVAADIIHDLEKTILNPEFFPPDRYKLDNKDNYRAFERHHYRISYKVNNNVIRVLRIRHTGMEPKEY
jgi:plasmid stabilization system protein ParE